MDTMTPPLYHAVDGDGCKLRDAYGEPLLLRKLGDKPSRCCNSWECEPVDNPVHIKGPLWFKETALREAEETK